ncbi:N-acetylmuramoyl-L-alanine amidase family protein [Salinimicrobium flavum]|uniref:N-acetylmuramoyl-L-alanine amidase n=1 Tax=Salinimicrobium flavum TaxID=1737065 RepID=A0ABW5IWU5_9FLAO
MRHLMKILGLLLITISLSFTNPDKKTVIIDVGHGGHDAGNTVNGMTEKEIVLSIAKKIKELNTNEDLEIILTRNTDQFISLEDRVKFINSLDADLMISLHSNAHQTSTPGGHQIFVSNENKMSERSSAVAESIKNLLSTNYSVSDIKNANFLVLKNSNCPAVMIELGFLTNENDREILNSEAGQDQIARTIYQALD